MMKITRIAGIMMLLALAGCNTVAGVGEDISGAARMVQGGVSGGGGY